MKPPFCVILFECDERGIPGRRIATVPCATAGIAADVAQYQSKRSFDQPRKIALVYATEQPTREPVVWYSDGAEQFSKFPANEFAGAKKGSGAAQLMLQTLKD